MSSRAYARFKLGVRYGCLAAAAFALSSWTRHLDRGSLILVVALVVGACVVRALSSPGRAGRG